MQATRPSLAALATIFGLGALSGPTLALDTIDDSVRKYDPATDIVLATFPTPAANAESFQKLYRAVAYDNSASTCIGCTASLTAITDSGKTFAHFAYNLPKGSTSTQRGCVGFQIPLDPLWSSQHDLRGLQSIRIKVRTRQNGTNNLGFFLGFEGPLTPYSSMGTLPEALGYAADAWEWQEIPIDDFDYATWMFPSKKTDFVLTETDSLGNVHQRTANMAFPTNPNGSIDGNLLPRITSNCNAANTECERFFHDSLNVLRSVRTLKVRLENPWMGTATVSGTIDIDSIILVHAKTNWAKVAGSACSGASLLLEDRTQERANREVNLLGGPWFYASDTGRPSDSLGHSRITSLLTDGATGPLAVPFEATLGRTAPAQHPFGGFAEVGTRLGAGTSQSIPQLKAVSFRIRPSATGFDSAKLGGLNFGIEQLTTGRDRAYSVRIPWSQFAAPATDEVCVDLSSLRQPAWWTGKSVATLIAPSEISALTWGVALQNLSDTAAVAGFNIESVRLWGPGTAAIKPTSRQAIALTGHGTGLELRGLRAGAAYRLDIFRLDGSLVQSLSGTASGTSTSIAAHLGNGTYRAVLGSESHRQTLGLSILQR